MDVLIQDIRYGVRQLLRQRGSSIVVILTLALGIGALTAVFTIIDAAILRPLPYRDPEQLVSVRVEVTQTDERVFGPTPSMDDMRFWQEETRLLDRELKKGSAELIILSILEGRALHEYLEERRWLQGRWVEESNQRRRRFYSLTAEGRRVLARQRDSWKVFVNSMALLKGVDNA